MILRFTYFCNNEDIIDQEPAIKKLDKDKVKYLSKEEFYKLTGGFAECIWKFSKKYEEIPFVVTSDNSKEYDCKFYFTEEEYKILQKEYPLFAKELLFIKDRLALDEKGILYDIDEDKPKSFIWYIFGVVIYPN